MIAAALDDEGAAGVEAKDALGAPEANEICLFRIARRGCDGECGDKGELGHNTF